MFTRQDQGGDLDEAYARAQVTLAAALLTAPAASKPQDTAARLLVCLRTPRLARRYNGKGDYAAQRRR